MAATAAQSADTDRAGDESLVVANGSATRGDASDSPSEEPASQSPNVASPSSGGAGTTAPSESTQRYAAAGAATNVMTPQSISLPTGEGSIRGMGESFAPQLSAGVATYSIPIAVAPGRAGVQPSLGIQYASSKGNGDVGIGWSFGVASISRQTDRGTPKYIDRSAYHAEEDRFVFNGTEELVPVDNATMAAADGVEGASTIPADLVGWQQYRARIEGAFARFFRSTDSRRWVVQTPSGDRLEFGELDESLGVPTDLGGSGGALVTDGTKVFGWNLSRSSDVHGSTIYYRYYADSNARYLRDIHYVSPASCATASGQRASVLQRRTCQASLAEYGARVLFSYETTRNDVLTSYDAGFASIRRYRLRAVSVSAAEGIVGARYHVRRYWLSYDPTSYHSLLTSVQLEGRPTVDVPTEGAYSATSARVLESDPGTGPDPSSSVLPAMRFSYSAMPSSGATAPLFGGLAGTSRAVVGSPDIDLKESRAQITDVNADGLADLLVTDPTRYSVDGAPAIGVYFNGFMGAAGTPAQAATFTSAIALPMSSPGLLANRFQLTNQALLGLDADGDGRGDYLHVSTVDRYGYFTATRSSATPSTSIDGQKWRFSYVETGTVGSSSNPLTALATDRSAFRSVDVNGDHLPDIVKLEGLRTLIWWNLGWLPGGHGTFGTATYVNGSWQISPMPTQRCGMYDSQLGQVLFTSSDVRLAEMNGDGLVDLVKFRGDGRFHYWPGHGDGTWGATYATCNAGSARTNGFVNMTGLVNFGTSALSGVFVSDVNGDGTDDVVRVASGALETFFNRGGVSFTTRIAVSMPVDSTMIANLTLTDVDGSGTPDLLNGRASAWSYIDLLGGVRPRLLTRIENGLGAVTDLTYASSTEDYLRDRAAFGTCTGENCGTFTWSSVETPNACDAIVDGSTYEPAAICPRRPATSPIVTTVVRSIRVDDHFADVGAAGAASVVTQTHFAYHDAYYDGTEFESRGFAAADSTTVGDSNSPTSTTRSWFHQGRRPTRIATDRTKDNPNEALKGSVYLTETFSEDGRYLSTRHIGFTVRAIAVGLDGRGISCAFESSTDEFRYSHLNVASANGASATVPGVAYEGFSPSLGASDESHSLIARHQALAWIRTTTPSDAVDNLGVVSRATAHGRVWDEETPFAGSQTVPASIDGAISTVIDSVLLNDDGQWLMRQQGERIESSTGATFRQGARGFDVEGNPSPSIVVALTDGLDYEFSGGSRPLTLEDEWLWTSDTFDAWGLSTAHCVGADLFSASPVQCLRYSETSYDEQYGALPILEKVATSLATEADARCNTTSNGLCLLSTSAEYERGFGVVTRVVDPNHQVTASGYDGLGRVTYVHSPAAAGCEASPSPQVRIRYVRNSGSKPVSYVETITDTHADWSSCPRPNPVPKRTYVDALGRPRGSIEAEHSYWRWVKGGVTTYDAKGQAVCVYDPIFSGSASDPVPDAPSATAIPNRARSCVERDAFGRMVASVAQDGARSEIRYGALRQQAWDPNDLGARVVGSACAYYGPQVSCMTSPAAHMIGTYAESRVDGHGRSSERREILRQPGETSGQIVSLQMSYRADGSLLTVTRSARPESGGAPIGSVVRTFDYDSIGRRIATSDPDSNRPGAPASTGHWRYLYNAAGDLVATRDPRGCGQDFYYDRAGRPLGERYVGCEEAQSSGETPTSKIPLGSVGKSIEGQAIVVDVLHTYDTTPGWAVAAGLPTSTYSRGRATGVEDRAQRTATVYDAAGNPITVARQVAIIPDALALSSATTESATQISNARELPTETEATRPQRTYDVASTYTTTTRFDNLGQPIGITLPHDPDWQRLGGQGTSPEISGHLAVAASGAQLASQISVGGSRFPVWNRYNYVDARAQYTFLGWIGGKSGTRVIDEWDVRGRLVRTQVTRFEPIGVTSPTGAIGNVAATDSRYDWDDAGNLTAASDWYLGANQTTDAFRAVPGRRSPLWVARHDSLYRVAEVDASYFGEGGFGDDAWIDPRLERARVNADGVSDLSVDPMGEVPAPMVAGSPTNRLRTLRYRFDWLANETLWTDDTRTFFERSIGSISNGAGYSSLRPSALYVASDIDANATGPLKGGYVTVDYGAGGNVQSMTVHGQCADASHSNVCSDVPSVAPSNRRGHLEASCSCAVEQHFAYRWDELNRIVEARRYDRSSGASTYALAARQRYRYDGSNQRIIKQSINLDSTSSTQVPERIHLYVNPGQFERVGVARNSSMTSPAYEGSATLGTETEYHLFGATVVYEPELGLDTSFPIAPPAASFDRDYRITYTLRNPIGSSALSIDLRSREVMQIERFLPNGQRDTLWTNERHSQPIERYGFTEKESDEEVGIAYFGQRYLIASLGRWASPDPLAIHEVGGGEAINSFHYVGGNTLQARDPDGLGVKSDDGSMTYAMPDGGTLRSNPAATERQIEQLEDHVENQWFKQGNADAYAKLINSIPESLREPFRSAMLTAELGGPMSPLALIQSVRDNVQLVHGLYALYNQYSERLSSPHAEIRGLAQGELYGTMWFMIHSAAAGAVATEAVATAVTVARAQFAVNEASVIARLARFTRCFTAETPVQSIDGPVSIDSIQVGTRVRSANDEVCDHQAMDLVQVDLALAGQTRGRATLLRPRAWVAALALTVGTAFSLASPELGAAEATVERVVERHVEAGEGCVVLSSYSRPTHSVVQVGLSTGEILRATEEHPFWVDERQAYLPAAELEPGYHLKTLSDADVYVDSLSLSPVDEGVYNLEVEGANSYYVGDDGVLVHNDCGLQALARFRSELGLAPGEGTLARLDVGGREFYGVNAHRQPVDMRVNPISRTHAETDAFQQARNAGIRGGDGVLYVDRPLCGACGRSGAVRSLARQLGLDRLIVVTPDGISTLIP